LVLAGIGFVRGRRRDIRNSFALPEGLWTPNLAADAPSSLSESRSDSPFAAASNALFDPNLTWDDIAWLTSISNVPVLVKGIVRADDAVHAVDAGTAGVIVSNHGDRQVITALSRNEQPGPMFGKEGLLREIGEVKAAWERQGVFALLNDATGCIRIGDVTKFREERAEIIEVKGRPEQHPARSNSADGTSGGHPK
jgi:hypothetical protein